MPVFIFVGWLVGILVAAIFGTTALVAFGLAIPAFLGALTGPIGAIITVLSAILAALLAMIAIAIAYIAGYAIATSAIAPLLPGLVPANTTYPLFPRKSLFPTAGNTPVTIPATKGEYFARGMLTGLTAALNLLVLGLIPVAGLWLGSWAFLLISLSGVIAIARNRVYQGFLGWAAWLFPMSLLASAIGLLLFVINWAFSFTALGLNAFKMDWTTGAMTSSVGLLTLYNNTLPPTARTGGFSVGNFIFLDAAPASADFTAPSLPSHETGHTLNTAASGAIVLLINWIDENFWPARVNLAYGELTAEGHAQNMPGTAQVDYAIKLWF